MPISQRQVRLLLLTASVWLIYMGMFPMDAATIIRHDEILNRTAQEPYRWRVLTVYLAELGASLLPAERGGELLLVHSLLNALLLTLFVFGLYAFLSRFVTIERALLGCLAGVGAFSVVITWMFNGLGDTWLESALFVWGLVLLHDMAVRERPHHGLYGVLVMLAALNRSTGVFLVLFFGLAMWRCYPDRRTLIWTVVYGGLWFGCDWLVRQVQGPGELYWTVGRIAEANLSILPYALTAVPAFLGGWWYLAWRGLRRTPPFLGTLTWGMLVYLGFVAVFGLWREVRLLVPVLPILLAVGLLGLGDDPGADPDGQGATLSG